MYTSQYVLLVRKLMNYDDREVICLIAKKSIESTGSSKV